MSQTYEDRPTLEQWNEVIATVGSMPKVAAGTYTGQSSSAESQTIQLSFTPRVLLVYHLGDEPFLKVNGAAHFYYGGLSTPATPVPGLQIITNGFVVCNASRSNEYMSTNLLDHQYNYLAIG